jgi:Flp pilus assembly secretin CpaC
MSWAADTASAADPDAAAIAARTAAPSRAPAAPRAATPVRKPVPVRPTGYSVPLDEVRMVTLRNPVTTVFVGNPVIADVTVIDPKHVFILGKTFGTTNLIGLDENGSQTINSQITVFDRPGRAVTLHRGAAKSTLVCAASRCEVAPTPGDEQAPFDAAIGQIDKRQQLSLKAAGNQ